MKIYSETIDDLNKYQRDRKLLNSEMVNMNCGNLFYYVGYIFKFISIENNSKIKCVRLTINSSDCNSYMNREYEFSVIGNSFHKAVKPLQWRQW